MIDDTNTTALTVKMLQDAILYNEIELIECDDISKLMYDYI